MYCRDFEVLEKYFRNTTFESLIQYYKTFWKFKYNLLCDVNNSLHALLIDYKVVLTGLFSWKPVVSKSDLFASFIGSVLLRSRRRMVLRLYY